MVGRVPSPGVEVIDKVPPSSMARCLRLAGPAPFSCTVARSISRPSSRTGYLDHVAHARDDLTAARIDSPRHINAAFNIRRSSELQEAVTCEIQRGAKINLKIMAHPRGVQQYNGINGVGGLTPAVGATQSCGVPALMANPCDPPPGTKECPGVLAGTTGANTITSKANGLAVTTTQSPTHQDKYDARLDALLALHEPEELRTVRKRLMKAIELSAIRLSNPHRGDYVATLDRMILNIASEHVYKLRGTATLQGAVNLCLRLRMAATMIERMEAGYDN